MNTFPVNVSYYNDSKNSGIILAAALKSDGIITFNKKNFTIKKNSSFLFSHEESFETDTPGAFTIFSIYGRLVSTLILPKLKEEARFCPGLLPDILPCIDHINKDEAESPTNSAKGYTLLMAILDDARPYEPVKESLPAIVEDALGIIRNESEYIMDIPELSERIGVSSEHLSREFKKHVGLPIGKYLRQVKIEKAKELLSQEDIAIYMISEICGFSDKDYFTRLFKNQTGMTPSQFRHNFRGRKKFTNDSIWA